ncbi:putative baseplate assembly protein [Lysobacter helvus]|uniref:Baseplate assembly protein n=2 Tax=Lysobacteraceae TaxID=32033 RepID=A0ABM7Q1D1_9GAMM|nr:MULTISPECIES: putative baseplate assembly protein [Lysobacter]BCT91013.1 putative baseplate assembly protein [Lysobacter caseinilyticus]BCT94166.1 putative baseplate assembly protein [Lysobacter helvus]
MSRLVNERFDRRFADLMAMGRAQLPALAPQWTDHNAHDPGITLMELLAWVAEAQLYAVGHTRRDERAAYAALLSLVPGGTQPARGLLWPDAQDPRSPAATFAQSVVIPADAVIHVVNADAPAFHPDGKVLWIPGDVQSITTRLAEGRVLDHTRVNAREGPAFQPFGERARPRDVLAIDFECRGDGGVFPPKRDDAQGAYWTLGVRASTPLVAGDTRNAPLAATLVTDTGRYPIAIVSDTTDGLLRTGALTLDLSAVPASPKRFTLELVAPRGLARAPRVLRIAPNVLPIVQGREIAREVHTVNATTDWRFQLDVPGLRFNSGDALVRIDVVEPSGQSTWQRCDDLATQGPADKVYALDLAADRITFGNGVNGRAPPEQAQVLAWYSVSDGAQGSVARNRKWHVQGFGEVFGVNPDAVAGGAGPDDWRAQRRESRRRAREDHALVSADDILGAALKLPLLDVARAWIVPPNATGPRTGTVTLVAMRGLRAGEEAARLPESRRWLDAIRRRLLARMPLGTRLMVVGPRYATFVVQATLEADAGRNVDDLQRNVMEILRKRLATTGPSARPPGVPVSRSDIAGWMRAVDGVARVVALQLVRDPGGNVASVAVARDGLPRLDAANSTIDVRRPGQGGAP